MTPRPRDHPLDWAAELGARMGCTHVRSAGADDRVGSAAAQACVRVESAAELQHFLRAVSSARGERPAVVARGGGTQIHLGNPPSKLDAILDTTAMDGILEYRPEDLTVTVAAGTTLHRLNRTLGEHGQRVVLDSDDPRRATIGGLLACDRPGGLSYAYGGARDRVLGLEVVDGRGRCLGFGGRVVKNVAGYDAAKLFLGSHGTLGIITQATLRTHPRPERSEAVAVRVSGFEDAERFRTAAGRAASTAAAFDVEVSWRGSLCDAFAWKFALRLEGSSAEVAAERDRVLGLTSSPTVASDATDGGIVDGVADTDAAPSVRFDCCVRIGCGQRDPLELCRDTARRFARGTAGILSRERAPAVRALLGAATVNVSLHAEAYDDLPDVLHEMRRQLEADGGFLVVESAPARVAERVECWGTPPAGFSLMRKIKHSYDPCHILSPGRFVGGL